MFSVSIRLVLSFLAFFLVLGHALPASHGAPVQGIGVPVSNADASSIIPNRYIVVYNANTSDVEVEQHQAQIQTAMRKRSLSTRTLDGRTMSAKMDTFSMTGWRAMALDAEDSMILEIANTNMVSLSEQNNLSTKPYLLISPGIVYRGGYIRQDTNTRSTSRCASRFKAHIT